MVTRETILLCFVVLLATLAAFAPAASAASIGTAATPTTSHAAGVTTGSPSTLQPIHHQQTATPTATGTATPEDEASPFGTQMAAFMQQNAAQLDDSVGNGMWEAGFERANASVRERMASARIRNVDGQVDRLVAENRTLTQRYRNGSLNRTEYLLAASQLEGRIEAFEERVTGTARAAERAGLNRTALEDLRHRARNLTGPAVAGIARDLVDGDRGPPSEAGDGGDENRPERPGDGPPADVRGNESSENRTEPPGSGPPDDVPGQPDENEDDEESGNGNQGEESDRSGPSNDESDGQGASGGGNDGKAGGAGAGEGNSDGRDSDTSGDESSGDASADDGGDESGNSGQGGADNRNGGDENAGGPGNSGGSGDADSPA